MSLSDVFRRATAWLKSDRDYWKKEAEDREARLELKEGIIVMMRQSETAARIALAVCQDTLASRPAGAVVPALPLFSTTTWSPATLAYHLSVLDQQVGNNGYLRLNLRQPGGVARREMDAAYVVPKTEDDLRQLVAWAHGYAGWIRRQYGRPEVYVKDERDCEDYALDVMGVLRSVTSINAVGLMINEAHAFLLAFTAQDGAFIVEAITGEVIRWEEKDSRGEFRMLSGLLLL